MSAPTVNSIIRDVPKVVYVKQKPKGVLLEMFCCAQNNEFAIGKEMGGWSPDGSDDLYVVEDASLFCRFCFGTCRETSMDLKVGGKADGASFVNFQRPFRCLASPCKCCCYQEINVTEMSSNAKLGSIKETFWCCVPQFRVFDAADQPMYDLHQPTCCLGMCVNCCDKGGCGCLRVPFYFYAPNGKEDDRKGELFKVWAGVKKECCTNANNFEVHPPSEMKPEQLPLVYATAVIVNQNFFENKGSGGG